MNGGMGIGAFLDALDIAGLDGCLQCRLVSAIGHYFAIVTQHQSVATLLDHLRQGKEITTAAGVFPAHQVIIDLVLSGAHVTIDIATVEQDLVVAGAAIDHIMAPALARILLGKEEIVVVAVANKNIVANSATDVLHLGERCLVSCIGSESSRRRYIDARAIGINGDGPDIDLGVVGIGGHSHSRCCAPTQIGGNFVCYRLNGCLGIVVIQGAGSRESTIGQGKCWCGNAFGDLRESQRINAAIGRTGQRNISHL